MELILEGSKLKTIEDFHNEIKSILGLPDHYGNNLDALSDCLTGWVETPLTLVWKDFEISKINLGDFAHKAISVFKDAENEVDGFKIEFH
jgi:ribonuclease inhibitor